MSVHQPTPALPRYSPDGRLRSRRSGIGRPGNRAGRAATPRAVDCWILTQAQKPGAGWAGASAAVNDLVGFLTVRHLSHAVCRTHTHRETHTVILTASVREL